MRKMLWLAVSIVAASFAGSAIAQPRRQAVQTPTPKRTNRPEDTIVASLYTALLPENCCVVKRSSSPWMMKTRSPRYPMLDKYASGSRRMLSIANPK